MVHSLRREEVEGMYESCAGDVVRYPKRKRGRRIRFQNYPARTKTRRYLKWMGTLLLQRNYQGASFGYPKYLENVAPDHGIDFTVYPDSPATGIVELRKKDGRIPGNFIALAEPF